MELQGIQHKIYEIRGHKIMLDFDLACLYAVETKALNLAVKRNSLRFPADFMFQLTIEEWDILRVQIETSNSLRLQNETLKKGRGMHTKYLPYAFTDVYEAINYLLNKDKVQEKQNSRKRIGFKENK
jgi:hypothetical protein